MKNRHCHSVTAATMGIGLLLALALPAMATAKVPAPTAPKATVAAKPGAPKPLDASWDVLLQKTEAKLRLGMTLDQVTSSLMSAQKSHKAGAVFDTTGVEEFVIPSTKRRVTVSLAFFRSEARTPHAILLAFESPIGDFRGANSKLLKLMMTTIPTPPISVLRNLKPQTVANYHEINLKTRYKFPTPY
jgi:hypothetical protein